jgi:hypothetical protein
MVLPGCAKLKIRQVFFGGIVASETKTKVYCIRIKEWIDSHWTSWLGDLSMEHTPAGETLIVGPIIDQSALHGILTRLRDMNLTLISVTPIECWEKDSQNRKVSE